MKKGFTLIELLGVILLLGILLLMATPVALDAIGKSEKKAAVVAMTNIKSAAQDYYYNKTVESLFFETTTFICDNNSCSNGIEQLSLDGNIPESGLITIDSKGNITMESMVIDGYSCIENANGFECTK